MAGQYRRDAGTPYACALLVATAASGSKGLPIDVVD